MSRDALRNKRGFAAGSRQQRQPLMVLIGILNGISSNATTLPVFFILNDSAAKTIAFIARASPVPPFLESTPGVTCSSATAHCSR